MTRIDRKTGEPILSPKLTVDQLYAMANEPGWRPCAAAVASPYHPRRCRRKTSRGRNPCLRRRSSLLPTIPRRRP